MLIEAAVDVGSATSATEPADQVCVARPLEDKIAERMMSAETT